MDRIDLHNYNEADILDVNVYTVPPPQYGKNQLVRISHLDLSKDYYFTLKLINIIGMSSDIAIAYTKQSE